MKECSVAGGQRRAVFPWQNGARIVLVDVVAHEEGGSVEELLVGGVHGELSVEGAVERDDEAEDLKDRALGTSLTAMSG